MASRGILPTRIREPTLSKEEQKNVIKPEMVINSDNPQLPVENDVPCVSSSATFSNSSTETIE